MITADGGRVYVNDDGVPSLYALGHSLGRVVRFNGHTRDFYPVMAHLMVVAKLLPDDAAVYGLMHDAAETCCADVPSTWKTKAAKAREARLSKRIYPRLGLEWPVPEDIEAMVAHADAEALAAEYEVCGGARGVSGKPQPRWEAPLEAERNPLAVAYTTAMADLCGRAPFDPKISAPMFAELFEMYNTRRVEYLKRQERNRRARERRAAATA